MKVKKCISKNINSRGGIVSYTLLDLETGQKMVATAYKIKQDIRRQEVQILNLHINEAGRLVERELPFRKAVTIKLYNYEDVKSVYLLTDGESFEITDEVVKELMKKPEIEFIDIELDANDKLIIKKVDYTKYKDWIDTEYSDMWEYIETMNKFTKEQREEIKEYIIKTGYGIDEEDLICLFTNSEEWFPSKFYSLDTMCRERALELMIKFKVVNPYKYKGISERYIKYLESKGMIAEEFKKDKK